MENYQNLCVFIVVFCVVFVAGCRLDVVLSVIWGLGRGVFVVGKI